MAQAAVPVRSIKAPSPGILWLRRVTFAWVLICIAGGLVLALTQQSLHVARLFLLAVWIAAVALSIARYVLVPSRKRSHARRLIIFLLGMLLLYVALASGRGNMQIEGLFFALLISLTHPSVV